MAVTCCTILINFNGIIFFEWNLIKFVWTASCYLLSVILHFCLCWTWLPAVHHCPSSACWATSDMCLYPSVPLWPSLSMHANLICICLSEPASVCVCACMLVWWMRVFIRQLVCTSGCITCVFCPCLCVCLSSHSFHFPSSIRGKGLRSISLHGAQVPGILEAVNQRGPVMRADYRDKHT